MLGAGVLPAAPSRGRLPGSALARRLRGEALVHADPAFTSICLFSPLSSEPDWMEEALLAGGSHALEELGQSFSSVPSRRTDASGILPIVTNQVLGHAGH